MRNARLDGLPHAAEVDVDHGRPVGLAGLVQGLATVPDAGVGDDDVEAAHLLDAGVHRGLERVVVADVDLGGEDPAVVPPLDQIRGLGQILGRRRCNQVDGVDLLTDVDGDDVGAFLGQAHRMRPPLSARSAGDESDLASTRPVMATSIPS